MCDKNPGYGSSSSSLARTKRQYRLRLKLELSLPDHETVRRIAPRVLRHHRVEERTQCLCKRRGVVVERQGAVGVEVDPRLDVVQQLLRIEDAAGGRARRGRATPQRAGARRPDDLGGEATAQVEPGEDLQYGRVECEGGVRDLGRGGAVSGAYVRRAKKNSPSP